MGYSPLQARSVISVLSPFVKERRVARMRDIMLQRRTDVQLVLENLVEDNNAAACIRTADAMGLQTIHLIEAMEACNPSRHVHRGALSWVDVIRHRTATECAEYLKRDGCELFVSDLSPCSLPIHAFRHPTLPAPAALASSAPVPVVPLSSRCAVAFGNEHRGASRELIAAARHTFSIPMVGFTSSLNVSVAVGMSLFHFLGAGVPVPLSRDEADVVLAKWLTLKVLRSKEILSAANVDVPQL